MVPCWVRAQTLFIAMTNQLTYVRTYTMYQPIYFAKIVHKLTYLLVAVGSSGILKGKQKLGLTFNSNKLGVIDLTKFSKLTMCSA